MRKLAILYFTIMHFISCGQSYDNSFIEKITGDYSRNSYYILIDIKSLDKSSLYLIENDDLFYYFHQLKGYNEKQYQDFIRPLIKEGRSITVNESDIKKYGFTAIPANKKLAEDIKKGKDYLLQRYFKNRVLKDGVSTDESNNIIAALFNWRIASRIDDESGYLIYYE